jgi:hypothetical protein
MRMEPTQTLHDFVLNLLTNPEALSAFRLDPEAALAEAGLDDVTAADVQDVVPLVVDYTSVHAAPSDGTAQVNFDVSADNSTVIGQLQNLTEQLAVNPQPTNLDGNLAVAGTLAADSTGLGLTAGGLGGVGVAAGTSGVSAGVDADLSGAYDVAGTLDSDVVEPVTGDLTGTVDSTTGVLDGGVGTTLDGVLGQPGGLTSGLDDPTDLVDSLGVTNDLGVTNNLPVVDDATGAVSGVLDGVGAGGLLDGSPNTGDNPSDLLEDPTGILF